MPGIAEIRGRVAPGAYTEGSRWRNRSEFVDWPRLKSRLFFYGASGSASSTIA